MCSCPYDAKIDVWSTGCILGELLGRKPLFPGDDYIKQMNLIFGTLGSPSKEDLAFITNEKALDYIQSLERKSKIPFKQVYPSANPAACDLLEKMLQFNPNKRISVDEALAHPYLAGLHNPKKEFDCKTMFDFEFERINMTKEILQDFMLEEIYTFRPGARPKGMVGKRTDKHFAQSEKDRKASEAKKKSAAAAKDAKRASAVEGKAQQPAASGAPAKAS
jgi:serine/threonine protein kinase